MFAAVPLIAALSVLASFSMKNGLYFGSSVPSHAARPRSEVLVPAFVAIAGFAAVSFLSIRQWTPELV